MSDILNKILDKEIERNNKFIKETNEFINDTRNFIEKEKQKCSSEQISE